MTSVSVDKDLLEDLVDSKLRVLQRKIEKILTRWKFSAVQEFLQAARDGTLAGAEDDAIVLRNLTDKRDELYALKKDWDVL